MAAALGEEAAQMRRGKHARFWEEGGDTFWTSWPGLGTGFYDLMLGRDYSRSDAISGPEEAADVLSGATQLLQLLSPALLVVALGGRGADGKGDGDRLELLLAAVMAAGMQQRGHGRDSAVSGAAEGGAGRLSPVPVLVLCRSQEECRKGASAFGDAVLSLATWARVQGEGGEGGEGDAAGTCAEGGGGGACDAEGSAAALALALFQAATASPEAGGSVLSTAHGHCCGSEGADKDAGGGSGRSAVVQMAEIAVWGEQGSERATLTVQLLSPYSGEVLVGDRGSGVAVTAQVHVERRAARVDQLCGEAAVRCRMCYELDGQELAGGCFSLHRPGGSSVLLRGIGPGKHSLRAYLRAGGWRFNDGDGVPDGDPQHHPDAGGDGTGVVLGVPSAPAGFSAV